MIHNLGTRRALIHACRRAVQCGIQTGNGGNISARKSAGTMLVKGTGGSFADVSGKGFVTADFGGKKISGKGEPTREALLHGYLYKKIPEIQSVVHVHAPYAIAWASTNERLERVTWQAKLKLITDIPILNIDNATVQKVHLGLIDTALCEYPGTRAFILKDHGIVAMGKNPADAEYLAEFIEETAKVAYLEMIVNREKRRTH